MISDIVRIRGSFTGFDDIRQRQKNGINVQSENIAALQQAILRRAAVWA
ncbi:MAG: hypothetical protein L7F77_16050 [Candidatus Magnetominusculus sp. LBB02]|nr:hypothetical protein [Candidatus Magnetominusculus sp. LBB02]